MYRPRTDWVRNVLAAQAARLSVDGREIELPSTRLLTRERTSTAAWRADGRSCPRDQPRAHTGRMGRFVITTPAVSIARELWRLGEPVLAQQAASLSPQRCADIGERAGDLYSSGEAARLWPGGPAGVTTALMLAATEALEGHARPCSRSRRLGETNLPAELAVDEAGRWQAARAVAAEMNLRLRATDAAEPTLATAAEVGKS